jgi:hypothetical protein
VTEPILLRYYEILNDCDGYMNTARRWTLAPELPPHAVPPCASSGHYHPRLAQSSPGLTPSLTIDL